MRRSLRAFLCRIGAPSLALGLGLVLLVLPGLCRGQVLWLDTSVLPGNFHRAWFLANGGMAANIMTANNTTLNAALAGLAANDRIYTVTHGNTGACGRRQGPLPAGFSGGRLSVDGVASKGFGTAMGGGSDPNGNCADGLARYVIPAQANITWRMMSCRADAAPNWGGNGNRSNRESADDVLPATSTVTGPVPDLGYWITYNIPVAGSTPAQKQACVATFGAWVRANQAPHQTTTAWFDNTAIANHGANVAALNAGPVAAYNLANGTAINVASVSYTYDPAIPGTPPVTKQAAEDPIDDPEPLHLCQASHSQVPVPALEIWALPVLTLILGGVGLLVLRRARLA